MRCTYRSVANLLPREFATSSLGHNDLALAVKAHDLHTHRARSSTLNLVLVAKQVDTGLSTAIIKATLDQHTQHGAFSSIDIADDGYSSLDDIIDRVRPPPDHQLSAARLLFGTNIDLVVATNILGHEYAIVGA